MNQKQINTQILERLDDQEKQILALKKMGRAKTMLKVKSWYKPGSTIEKIIILNKEGFFNKPKSLKEIISKFETRDYPLKASDLTLPLRKVVRKRLLEKTKQFPDGNVSAKWLYIKVKA